MFTLDIDIGGTFTDGFLTGAGDAWRVKVPTTPHDLSLGVLDCIRAGSERLGLGEAELLSRVGVARLSTTIGTNTLLQRNGPRVGLVVARGHASDLYGVANQLAGIVPPELVREIDLPLVSEAVLGALRDLLSGGARILAVSLPDPDTESAVRALARERYPENYLRRVIVQGSWELCDIQDDGVRTATVALNAYLHPVMVRELYRIEDELRACGLRRPLLIVHNSGGVARVAKTTALQTYSSGPVAGLFGAARLAAAHGWSRIVTFDMGGTSSDVGIAVGGAVLPPQSPAVEGIPVALPMYHTDSVGVAGGSLAHVGGDRVLIGPKSAGSVPGPACYGRGGDRPTVTDADLLLAYLAADAFLGGRQRLDPERARSAIERHVAEPLGLDVPHAAALIREAADASVARSLRAVLADAAASPEGFTLLAFGGAGPVHACDVARRAGLHRVLVVPFGSVFDAFGASTMDVTHLYARALAGREAEEAEAELRRLAAVDMRGEGFPAEAIDFVFDRGDGRVRLRASCAVPHWEPAARAAGGSAAPRSSRPVGWVSGDWRETPVFDPADLGPGSRIAGPALVEYEDTALPVPPGWRCVVDGIGNCVVEWGDER